MPARRLSARWVVPVDAPPVEQGAVLLDEGGRIAAVGAAERVPQPDWAQVEDFGNAVLLPGLVNTHTHLELTGFGAGAPDPDFAAWIAALRARKASRSPDAFLAAARQGLADCWAAGVTTVADTGDSGAVAQALAEAGGSGIAYHEVFGPHPGRLEESLAGLAAQMDRLSEHEGGRVRLGVSPHAPYTVSGPLYRAVADWARGAGLPVAVHLAESPAETALLADGTGPFAQAWRRRDIPLPAPLGRTPVGWLDLHGVLDDRTLCIHVVQAGAEDIRRLAATGAAVAHCPRSNRAHAHGTAPLSALLAAGLRLGVGTDSVASVEALDLLAEARAAQALASLDAARAVALCTLEAARALGLEADIGSLRPGKWGDLVVLRTGRDPGSVGPEAQALASGPSDVLATFVGGRDVYRANRSL